MGTWEAYICFLHFQCTQALLKHLQSHHPSVPFTPLSWRSRMKLSFLFLTPLNPQKHFVLFLPLIAPATFFCWYFWVVFIIFLRNSIAVICPQQFSAHQHSRGMDHSRTSRTPRLAKNSFRMWLELTEASLVGREHPGEFGTQKQSRYHTGWQNNYFLGGVYRAERD